VQSGTRTVPWCGWFANPAPDRVPWCGWLAKVLGAFGLAGGSGVFESPFSSHEPGSSPENGVLIVQVYD